MFNKHYYCKLFESYDVMCCSNYVDKEYLKFSGIYLDIEYMITNYIKDYDELNSDSIDFFILENLMDVLICNGLIRNNVLMLEYILKNYYVEVNKKEYKFYFKKANKETKKLFKPKRIRNINDRENLFFVNFPKSSNDDFEFIL